MKSSISVSKKALPFFLKPVLWSYDISALDAEKDKRLIIVQIINYGDFSHWRWLVAQYGKREIAKVLESVPASELRERVRPLAAAIFSIKKFNYAPRGTARKS